ncbi:GGDEF domain-containing protein [Legionella tucsonensis]|uniref:Putative regulatory protein (GGDEF domain) n=1 Tax=Legionella tucsonensis TaxID=40335 RepID=A0A0W0ZWF4_9GAMM|nr:GGDEF domain-containing protein [Legionella tucsonensis]KTD73416.1 putative regulatory protein (GGDEF domain) [Legionella tucsonensis]
MPSNSITIEKEHAEQLFIDYLTLLNQNLLLSIPANFLCSLIAFIGLYDRANQKHLLIWFMTSITAFILNAVLFFFNRSHPIKSQYYLRVLIGLTIIYGALWGIAGSVLIPYNDLLNQMLIISIVIGVASGGLHILQPNRTASLLFFMLTILPLSFWLFYQDASTYLLLGGALLVYFCFILTVSWMGYGFLNNNFKLRYENLDLINQLIKKNATQEESELRFRSAFNSSAIAMALVSLEGEWLKVNEALCQLLGYSEKELLNTNIETVTYPDDLNLDLYAVQQLFEGTIKSYHLEKRYVHKNNSIIWILFSCSLIRDTGDQPLYMIIQIQNIDAQKKAEQELKYIAYHDVLTGLANRKQLELSFEHALTYAKRHQKQIAIMFLDLDYFKEVNDHLGHYIGDKLLIETGKRLKSSLRETDIIARQGGDEFIVALTELSDIDQVINVAKKILISIAKPITIKNHEISITASIGISLYPQHGDDLYTLIKLADEALYEIKTTGKNNFLLFNKSISNS